MLSISIILYILMLSFEVREVDLDANVSQLLEGIIPSRQKSADIVVGTMLNQLHQSKEGQRDKSRREWVTEPSFVILNKRCY